MRILSGSKQGSQSDVDLNDTCHNIFISLEKIQGQCNVLGVGPDLKVQVDDVIVNMPFTIINISRFLQSANGLNELVCNKYIVRHSYMLAETSEQKHLIFFFFF